MLLGSLFYRRRGANSRLLDDLRFLKKEPPEIVRENEKKHITWEEFQAFRNDAVLFHKRLCGILPPATPLDDVVDRAAQVRLLEGKEKYDTQFVAGGPVDSNTGKPYSIYSREYQQWASAQEKAVLKDEETQLIGRLEHSVHTHPHARELLADGIAHGVVRTAWGGLHCQDCIDWYSYCHGIVGLVLRRELNWVEDDLRNGVVHRLAFQRDLIAQVTGKKLPVHVVVVEKSIPHRCGVWQISRSLLRKARKKNLAIAVKFRECAVSRPLAQRIRGGARFETIFYLRNNRP